ncbi:hypothetical protein ACROYT_G004193 [Oculina patagonica]
MFARQREMRLFEIQFLLAFCLVFAEGFVMDMYIPTGTTGDEVAVENLDDGTDFDAEKASMEDTPKDEVRRQLRPTRPPIIRPVHIPLTNQFFKGTRIQLEITGCLLVKVRDALLGGTVPAGILLGFCQD